MDLWCDVSSGDCVLFRGRVQSASLVVFQNYESSADHRRSLGSITFRLGRSAERVRLHSRIEKSAPSENDLPTNERGSSASGGLHMIIDHVDDTPLPEPIETGGLTITMSELARRGSPMASQLERRLAA